METVSNVHVQQGTHRRELVRRVAEAYLANDLAFARASEIFIKPNLIHHVLQLASTHVDAVRGLLDVVREKTDAPVFIGDGSRYNTKAAFRNFGYVHLENEYPNVRLVDLNDHAQKLEHEHGWHPLAKHCSYRIILTPMKTDRFVGASLSVESWVTGATVVRPHYSDIGPYYPRWNAFHAHGSDVHCARIQAVYHECPAQMAIIDGVIALTNRGPLRGDKTKLGVVIGGDPISADREACVYLGIDPEGVGYLSSAKWASFQNSLPNV